MDHISADSTTQEIQREIGDRLRSYRLQQNRSLDELAVAAGVGRATVVRAEAGRNPGLESLVRILRALGRLESLDAFLPRPPLSPIQLAKLGGHERQRARKPKPPRASGTKAGSEDGRGAGPGPERDR